MRSWRALGGLGHRVAGIGEEQAPIGLRLDQPVALQPSDRGRHRRLGNTHAAGDLDRPGFAFLAQQVGDELDIVLRGRRAVGLTLALEAHGMVIGRWKGRLAGLRVMTGKWDGSGPT